MSSVVVFCVNIGEKRKLMVKVKGQIASVVTYAAYIANSTVFAMYELTGMSSHFYIFLIWAKYYR